MPPKMERTQSQSHAKRKKVQKSASKQLVGVADVGGRAKHALKHVSVERSASRAAGGRAAEARRVARTRAIVSYTFVAMGVAALMLTLAGSMLLLRSEACRNPKFTYYEEFRYRIDTETPPGGDTRLYAGSKLAFVRGGLIRHLNLTQQFGKYTIVGNDDPEEDELVIRITNRAASKADLKRLTVVDVQEVNVTDSATGVNSSKWDIQVRSNTGAALSGETSCRRADIQVVVPTTCLLDETSVLMNVTTGPLLAANLSKGSFERLTLYNGEGTIKAVDTASYRLDLDTLAGSIDADGLTAHTVFLLARGGDVGITARNVHLYGGEDKASCRVCPGGDRCPAVQELKGYQPPPEIVCDEENGKLTVDSEGGDFGLAPVVKLGRVTGGDASVIVRTGHIEAYLMACYDFAGNYTLTSTGGHTGVQVHIEPVVPGSLGDLAAAARGQMDSADHLYTLGSGSAKGTVTGAICPQSGEAEHSGVVVDGRYNLEMRAKQYGNVKIGLFEPVPSGNLKPTLQGLLE